MGMVVGIPFLNSLKRTLKKSIGAIGVDYNNSVAGYLAGGDSAGGTTMSKMITDQVAKCPNSKLVVGGYR